MNIHRDHVKRIAGDYVRQSECCYSCVNINCDHVKCMVWGACERFANVAAAV